MNLRIDWVLDEDPALCYKEGFRAFVKQVGKSFENPYRPGSTAYEAFQAGWHFGRCSFSALTQPLAVPKKAGKGAGQLRLRSNLPVLRAH